MRYSTGDIVWARIKQSTVWPAWVTKRLGGDMYEVTFILNREQTTLRVSEASLFDFTTTRRKFERTNHSNEFRRAVDKATEIIMEKGAYAATRIRRAHVHPDAEPKKKRKYTHHKRGQGIGLKVRVPRRVIVRREVKREPRRGREQEKMDIEVQEVEDVEEVEEVEQEQEDEQEVQQQQLEEQQEDVQEQAQEIVAEIQEQPQQLSQPQQPKKSLPPPQPLKPKQQSQDVATLRHLNTTANNLINRLHSNPKIPKTPSDVTRHLQSLLTALKKPQVTAQDLFVTRTSNMIYFLIGKIRNSNTNKALTNELAAEIERRKEEFTRKFMEPIEDGES